MNTSIQHPINSPNIPKKVDLLSDQILQIESIQWLIGNINWKVGDTIIDMKKKRDEFLENQKQTLKTSQYFELARHHLEKYNHGIPQCSRITLNRKDVFQTLPQAWSKEINGQIEWYYNYPGACAEAEFLKRKIPTIDQWIEMLWSVPGESDEKARILNIPLSGYRNAYNSYFHYDLELANVWSSSLESNGAARYVILGRGYTLADTSSDDRGYYAMSLRFLSDME